MGTTTADIDCLDLRPEAKIIIYKMECVEISTVPLIKDWFEVGQVIKPTLSKSETPAVVMKKCTDNDKNMHKRFVESYQRLRSCNHTNIVTAFFASEIDGHSMFVMEHGEHSLAGLIKETKAFPTDEKGRNAAGNYTMSHCINWTKQIADALDYLHVNQKIIHRDVKCANILLFNKSTLCKLSDFDDCRYLSDQMTPEIGTPNHMAPEVAKLMKSSDERRKYTEKCDCYSLGVTILEMIFRNSTGNIPKVVAEEGATVKWYYSAKGDFYSLSLESTAFDHRARENEFRTIKSILDSALHADPEKRDRVGLVLAKLQQLPDVEPPALDPLVKSSGGGWDASQDDRRSIKQEQRSVSNNSCCVFYTVSFTDALQANFNDKLSNDMETVLNAVGNRANTKAATDANEPFVAKHKFQVIGEQNTSVLKIQHTIGSTDAKAVAKYCEESPDHTDWLAEQFKEDNEVSLRSLQFAIWRSANLDNNDDVNIVASDLEDLQVAARVCLEKATM